jgi:PTH1 family peptidyl-tRNA hydrolase
LLRLAVFLGNPGAEFRRNRHNAGRLLLEKLAFYDALVWRQKFKGLFSRIALPRTEAPEREMLLLQPETFMNLSGGPAKAAASFYRIGAPEIIIVHDELELPLGTVSLKYGGGLGGHNGLRSIKDCFGTADFWRLRIGIGRPPGRLPGEGGPPGSGGDVYHWVLADFSAAESPVLDETCIRAAAALLDAFTEEPERLLGEWKKKRLVS